ncbi:thioredoxin [Colletotrichum truncatum]|uniref:Thioredoxin n=1 Tax=Colletotrichum truncatum TaxID=5467 RepID=A0ACC3YFE3_COLTU|nr:thioredoxin [Colletotrichum truncatum]KAF6788275.1 thioredoxin [Colletotrichum truncatum]
MSLRLFRPVQRIAKSSIPSTYRNFHASSPNMVVHNLTSKAEFDALLEDKTKPAVILDAFATWCGPCKAIAPILVNLSNHKDNKKLHFVKLDVDEIPEVSQELGIRAMPTFIIFKHGQKAQEIVGANPNALTQAVAKLAEEFPSPDKEEPAPAAASE